MINTRLLIRTNTEIRILDTEYYDNGYVALRVDDITNYDIRVGDILSVRFDNPSLAPEYAGSHEVIIVSPTSSCCLSDNENSIVLALAWSNSTPVNSGWAKNILRVNSGGLLADVGSGFSGTGLNGFAYMQATDQFSDGALLVGGFFTQYTGTGANMVVGINLDGTIDTLFVYGTGLEGSGGGGLTVATNIKVDSLDRAYITGGFLTYNGTTSRNIVRVLRDGTLDTSFNVGSGLQGSTTFGYSIEIDEINNKVYIGGEFTSYNGTSLNRIVRVLEDGSIDTSFNIGTGFDGPVRKILVFDNKVYVIGEFNNYNGNLVNRIVRLNLDGSYDNTFNNGGTGFNNGAAAFQNGAYDIIVASGKIYVVGQFTNYNGVSANRIIRINFDGSRDLAFDIGSGFSGTAWTITQHNGFLYVGGSFTSYNGETSNRLAVLDFYGNRNPNFIGVFNDFIQVILPVGENEILIGGNFTSYNGQNINRISIFRSFFTSIIYQPVELDLRDDIQFPLTFNLVDIRSPQNRKSDFSKTITLPGTDSNNRVLKHLFEISADSIFNPNIKKDVFVINDGLEVFSGFMKLEKINRDDWNNVTYDIKIFGRLTTLFSKLVNDFGEDLLVNDLKFPEYFHEVTRDNIISSWNGEIQKNGTTYSNYILGPTFSVIDTNFGDGARTKFVLTSAPTGLDIGDVVRFTMDFPNDPTVNFNQSQGHHTIIDIGTNSVTVNLEFRSGATNSGELVKWGSKGEGYVYPTINFGKINNLYEWQPSNYYPHFYLKSIIDKTFDYIGFEYESNFFNTDFFKRLIVPYGDYDQFDNALWLNFSSPSTIVATNNSVPTNAPFNNILNSQGWDINGNVYTAQSSGIYEFNFSLSGRIQDFTSISGVFDVRIYTQYNPQTNSQDPNWNTGTGYLGGGINNYNKRVFQASAGQFEPTTSSNVTTNLNLVGTTLDFDTDILFTGINIPVNTSFRVMIYYSDNLSPGDRELFVDECNFSNQKTLSNDREFKVRDLMTSLINMFNLYIETDSFNPKKVRIEPYENFYTNNDSRDWTNKLDLSKQIQIQPTAPDISKNFRWSYNDDGDLLNKDYKDNYNKVYGEFSISAETQFNNDTTQFSVAFSQTPVVDTNTGGRLIIPTIVRDQNYSRLDKWNPRIYYWTGIRYIQSFKLEEISTSDYYDIPMFGYAGHFDNPKDATLDLNFGYSEKYYYGSTYPFYITENTLYNRFYRNYIEEIIDKDSRILRAYFKVDSYDINTLKFDRFYYINNDLYRLQSIIDWDPINTETTLCEFIKVNRSLNSIGNRRQSPIIIGNISRNRNPIIPNVTIYGGDNVLGTNVGGVVIVGNGNNVESNSQNGFVFGNGNTVSGTSSNVFLVGNNITAADGSIVLGGPGDTVNVAGMELVSNKTWEQDNSFNTNLGTGFSNLSPTGNVNDVKLLSNGKILVGGAFTQFNGNSRNSLVRLNSDGLEDLFLFSTFGGTGEIFFILEQPDGKILVGGSFNQYDGNGVAALIRFNSDFTEDTTFSSNLGSGFTDSVFTSSIDGAVIQDDGKIVAWGVFDELDGVPASFIVRLNNDGTRDNTFPSTINNFVYSIKKIENKLLIIGNFNIGGDNYIALYEPGVGFTTFPGLVFDNPLYRCLVQSDGKIILSGFFTDLNGNVRDGIVRLNSDFTEDVDFYNNLIISGITTFPSEPIEDIEIVGDKIILVGVFTTVNGNTRNGIIGLNLDGSEDVNFYNDISFNGGVVFNPADLECIENLGGGEFVVGGRFTTGLGIVNNTRFTKFRVIEVTDSSVDNFTIENVLKLEPRTSDPNGATTGDIYYRQGVGIKFFDGSVWRTLSFT